MREATGMSDKDPEADSARDVKERDVIVLGSGNLGLVYLMESDRRLTLEEIEASHPQLVPALRAHPHIGFVLLHSERDGPVALGTDGAHYLADGRIEGTDPLAPFPAGAADHLRRTDGFGNAPDILVNSFYDGALEQGCAFEELISFHGGLGGPQTRPFLLVPTGAAAARRADRGRRRRPRPAARLAARAASRDGTAAAQRRAGRSERARAGGGPAGVTGGQPGAAARVTWLGHSTVLIDQGGVRVLTDPVLRRRIAHLRRSAAVAPEAVSDIDVVLISHVHYDHLDMRSLARLGRSTAIVVPDGGAGLLRRRGFRQVVEAAAGETRRRGRPARRGDPR